MEPIEIKKLLYDLEKLRKALDWSQSQAAQMLGIPLGTYRFWLISEVVPSSEKTGSVEEQASQLIEQLRDLHKQLEDFIRRSNKIVKRKR